MLSRSKFLQTHWLIIFLPVILILLYFPLFSVYFSHDDFFHFNIARIGGRFDSFLDFFSIQPHFERGYGFYRPITREAFYYIYHQLFGINHIPFRIISMVLQVTNSLLVYALIFKLFKNRIHAVFSSFFFAISTATIALLYYSAGGIQIQFVVFFGLLSLYFFEQYVGCKNIWMRMVSLLFFVLALGSHEIAIVIPFLLAVAMWVQKNTSIRETVIYVATEMLAYWFILFLYLYANIFVIGHPQDQVQYQASISPKAIVNAFLWYSGWALGLPEMLIDFVPPGFRLDERLFRFWGSYFQFIFPAFFTSIVLLTLLFIKQLVRNAKKFLDRRFIFLLLWFIVSLAPMLIYPHHKSSYYLGLAQVGFWGTVGYVLVQNYKSSKRAILLMVIAILSLNVLSIKLSQTTFPSAQRGKIAQKLIEDIKSQYPNLPQGATIYVQNDPNYPFIAEDWGGSAKQASFVLSNENAFQVLYDDTTLKVIYEGQNDTKIDYLIYPFVAKIPLN